MYNKIHPYFRLAIIVIFLLSVWAIPISETAHAANYYARDLFSAASYSNQDGTINWTSNWSETNDDGSPTGGNVRVSGSELQISSRAYINDADLESIQRSIDLSIAQTALSASLNFTYRLANLESSDTLVVEIFNGSTWTTLETLSGGMLSPGTRYYDISAYASANSAIRFRISGGFEETNESIFIDNVLINIFTPASHIENSVLQTVQTYYIPVREDQALLMMKTVNTTTDYRRSESPTALFVSISVTTDGTVIYYDHWEDGFESLVNNPQQNSSEVWGDSNPANGMPPGYSVDYLEAGDIIILNNWVQTTNLEAIDFDGGDKIASTQAIAVTRTSWASGSGTLHGGSVEMLDTSVWGTRYDIPADATVQANDFEYAGAAVMASQDNTQIYRNGSLVTTLNEGQSYLFNGNLALNDKITASGPVQVNFLTGDIGSTYESSWFTLYPFDLLGSSYYAPVNSEGGKNTVVFLHNPNSNAITVQWTTTLGAQAAINIPAGGWGSATMPTNASGARFYTTTGDRFQAISVIDSGASANDWGYTLIPDNQLTQQAMVGWGVGRDPTSAVNPNENGSPVWVVAVGSGTMNICVDNNGDEEGPYTDSNGHRYDQLFTLPNLGRAKIYDPDGDQTGMLVYLCNGSEIGNVNKIAVAWGQDPATASASAPGLDVGTSVPPLPNFTAIKGVQLTGDLNGDGKFDLGDTFEYQIRINNVGALPIPAGMITVQDIVPSHTTYVRDSTRLNGAPISDDLSGTPYPFDGAGHVINEVLPIGGQFIVSFRVQINFDLPGMTNIQNQAQVSGLNLHYNPDVEIVVDPPSKIGDRVWLDIDGDGLQDAGEPGLAGVVVELDNGTCTQGVNCPVKITDGNGQYTFSGLADGVYTVVVRPASLPGGVTQTGDPDGCPGTACDNRHTVQLGPGSINKPYWSADFGYQGSISIGDFVWFDSNRNGLQDGGVEIGLNGVAVSLTWAGPDGNLATVADNFTISTETDHSGLYHFNGLPAGTYSVDLVESSLPMNYAPTTSDPLIFTNLSAGANITNADFGAASGASIGDYVWNDMDGNAIQGTGESGLAGLRVYLDSNSNGYYDVGESYAVTDLNGYYSINHLSPGSYNVRVDANTIPAGYALTTANIPLAVNLTAGETYTAADFGYRASL